MHEQLQSWLRMWYHYSAMSNFVVGIAKVQGHEYLITACSSWRYDYVSTPYCRYVFNQCFVVCFIFLIQKWLFSTVLPVHAMNAMKRRLVYSQVWTSTRPSDVGPFQVISLGIVFDLFFLIQIFSIRNHLMPEPDLTSLTLRNALQWILFCFPENWLWIAISKILFIYRGLGVSPVNGVGHVYMLYVCQSRIPAILRQHNALCIPGVPFTGVE